VDMIRLDIENCIIMLLDFPTGIEANRPV